MNEIIAHIKKKYDSEPENLSFNSEQNGEIGILLRSYDDLFSDFDPRSYSHRALSEDFLSELQRSVLDRLDHKINLVFYLGFKKTDLSIDEIIKKRIKEHFSKHFSKSKIEKSSVIKEGSLFIVSGFTLMLITSYLTYAFIMQQNFFFTFITVVFEPAGWFLFWEGLNLLIFETKRIKSKYIFNKKMNECKIEFYVN